MKITNEVREAAREGLYSTHGPTSGEEGQTCSINGLACMPSGVSFLIASRSKSPVEMWTTPNALTMRSHWVPFPHAGGPEITRRSGRTGVVEEGAVFSACAGPA